MNYDSKNTGGIGFEVIFPDSVGLENIKESQGRYEGANIERLEIEALISGMEYIINIYKKNEEILSNINTIIFVTDRFRLNDKEGTSPFKIQEWRKNKWCNHEGKEIKNHDLLDKLDKKEKNFPTLHAVKYSLNINQESKIKLLIN